MELRGDAKPETGTVLDTGLKTALDVEALEAAEQQPLDMSVSGVLAAARERTGLTDFGPDDFIKRLALLLGEIERDDNMWRATKADFLEHCSELAGMRARVQDYLKRHPEVSPQRIERPIIVVGLSRSGTTHVENLIAADPRLRHLPVYLGAEPVPRPGEPDRPDRSDPRWARSQARWAATSENQAMAAMHEHSPDHACGENELQASDFASYEWEWRGHLPGWRDAYLAEDQTPHFEYARTLLKAIALQVPGAERWLLKGNGHSEQLRPLMRVYPDATIVMTHRDPVAILQSLLTMRGILAKRGEKRFDARRLADYWVDRVERMLRAYLRDMALVPDTQRIDLLFPEIMRDDIGAASRVLEQAGLPVNAASLANLQAYMAAHPRGKRGRVAYDLKGDFGLDADALYERFDFYFRAFPLTREVR